MTYLSRCLLLTFFFYNLNVDKLFSQICTGCTYQEVVNGTPVCDFDSAPTVNCTLVTGVNTFSGQLFDFGFGDLDVIDSYNITLPAGTEIYEVEWQVVDFIFPVSGTINISSHTVNFTGMGFEDTISSVIPITPALSPSTYNCSVTIANTMGFEAIEWIMSIKVRTCSSMLSLSGTISSSLDEESMDWIASTQTLQAGAIVDYDAADSIILQPGFHAELGSIFHAFIDGCGNLFQQEDSEIEVLAKQILDSKINAYTEENLLVYPNPTRQLLQIEYSLDSLQPISLYLVDFSGKIIKVFKKNKLEEGAQKEIFDFNNRLAKGLYQIVLHTEKGVFSKKVIYNDNTGK